MCLVFTDTHVFCMYICFLYVHVFFVCAHVFFVRMWTIGFALHGCVCARACACACVCACACACVLERVRA